MVVTTSNLYSESRKVLKTLLDDNVIDPKTDNTNSNRRWVYREFPDTTSMDFSGYPIIVLSGASIDDNPEDLQNYTSDGEFVFSLDIYAEFNDVNARIGSISDNVHKTFRIRENQNELAKNGLYEVKLSSDGNAPTSVDNKLLSRRSFSITVNATLEDC